MGKHLIRSYSAVGLVWVTGGDHFGQVLLVLVDRGQWTLLMELSG